MEKARVFTKCGNVYTVEGAHSMGVLARWRTWLMTGQKDYTDEYGISDNYGILFLENDEGTILISFNEISHTWKEHNKIYDKMKNRE